MPHFAPIRVFMGMPALLLVAGCGGSGASGPESPVITGSPPSGMTGIAYPAFAFAVASGGVAPFTWSETGALPPGLSWSPTAPQLIGTPVSAGTYPLRIMVADSSTPPLTGTVSVSVQIADSPIVVAPTPAPPAGTVSYGYPGFAFVASGGSPPFAWSVTAGALPGGLRLAGNGSLTGTPSTVGPATFTVTATDSASPAKSGSHPFTITVGNPPPPTVNNTPPPTATVGAPYSFQFTSTGGLAPFVWSATGAMAGLTVDTAGVLSGTPTSAGHFPILVDVHDSLMQSAPSTPFTVRISLARPPAAFTSTGSMLFTRIFHTATLLTTGKVLVTGGLVGEGAVASAELYDPATGMFARTMGDMTELRYLHTAALLNDAALPNYGRVLIVGGSASLTSIPSELYDPASGTFTATPPLAAPRLYPTSTSLLTGKVLIVGGNTSPGDLSAELYDPATGNFTSTGSTHILRIEHTATLLLDGRVLVAGGQVGGNAEGNPDATAEVYDPSTGNFTATGNMTIGRSRHAAARLQDGRVLVVGTDGSADLYDPATGMFAAVGNAPGSYGYGHTASPRADGTVLVAGDVVTETTRGGSYGRCVTKQVPVSLANAELFAPESEGFAGTGSLITAREGHTATVLADGTVLVAGGRQLRLVGSAYNCTGAEAVIPLSSAELFK